MKGENEMETAKTLVEMLKAYHLKKRPSRGDNTMLEKILDDLAEKGLIIRSVSDRIGRYVIRHSVNGSPILLDPISAEIYLVTLEFARDCRDAWKRASPTGSPVPSILKVIE